MNINNLDLNLLRVFDTIYKERNITRAAERIGLAQSSMSNALKRLRDQFNDPLFQRSPDGMLPTARADEIALQVRQMLVLVEEIIEPPKFDPALADEHILIAAADAQVMTIAPKLIQYLNDSAPKLRVSFVSLDKTNAFEQLDEGRCTLVIGTFKAVPNRFHRKVLSKDHFVCIARDKHPSIKQTLSLSTFTQLRHVLMTFNSDYTGVVDKALKAQGLSREIAASCAQFSVIPDIVANSDFVATIPASLAAVAKRSGCVIYKVPITLPDWEIEVIWSQRSQSTAVCRFVVNAIFQLSNGEGN